MNCPYRFVHFKASFSLLLVHEAHLANCDPSQYSFTNTNFAVSSLVAVLASEDVLLHSDLGLIAVLKMPQINENKLLLEISIIAWKLTDDFFCTEHPSYTVYYYCAWCIFIPFHFVFSVMTVYRMMEIG